MNGFGCAVGIHKKGEHGGLHKYGDHFYTMCQIALILQAGQQFSIQGNHLVAAVL